MRKLLCIAATLSVAFIAAPVTSADVGDITIQHAALEDVGVMVTGVIDCDAVGTWSVTIRLTQTRGANEGLTAVRTQGGTCSSSGPTIWRVTVIGPFMVGEALAEATSTATDPSGTGTGSDTKNLRLHRP